MKLKDAQQANYEESVRDFQCIKHATCTSVVEELQHANSPVSLRLSYFQRGGGFITPAVRVLLSALCGRLFVLPHFWCSADGDACEKVGLVSQGRSDLDPQKSAIEEISQGEETIQVTEEMWVGGVGFGGSAREVE